MNDFIFQNTTKIYFGKNQLGHLGEEIKNFGEKVLLVYGGGSIKKIGLYDRILSELEKVGVEIFELAGVEPNPRHTTVNKGAKICHEKNIQILLAVGGGSVIDCAKGIAATFYCESGDCWDLVTKKFPIKKALPVFAIPTVAATGSEMDSSGVISNIETNEKRGISSKLIQPKVSFLDPTNTFSVSAYQTACGSADIISHFLDLKYFADDNQKMYMLDKIVEEILKTVVKFAPIAIKEPKNYEARANLMWSASWALNSFLTMGIKQTPSVHAMEHELSAFYDVTHGLGIAIITPRWMEYILQKNPEKVAPQFKKFGVNIFGVDENLSDMEGAKEAIEKFKEFLFVTLGLKSKLSDLNIDDKNFAEMSRRACPNGELKGFLTLTPKDVEKIFYACL